MRLGETHREHNVCPHLPKRRFTSNEGQAFLTFAVHAAEFQIGGIANSLQSSRKLQTLPKPPSWKNRRTVTSPNGDSNRRTTCQSRPSMFFSTSLQKNVALSHQTLIAERFVATGYFSVCYTDGKKLNNICNFKKAFHDGTLTTLALLGFAACSHLQLGLGHLGHSVS